MLKQRRHFLRSVATISSFLPENPECCFSDGTTRCLSEVTIYKRRVHLTSNHPDGGGKMKSGRFSLCQTFYPQSMTTRRMYSVGASEETTFHEVADTTLSHVHDVTDRWMDDNGLLDCDIDYDMGVLTISLGTKGTFILNKQVPTRQIWLSSPASGPSHYCFCQKTQAWRDTRNGSELLLRLEDELFRLNGFRIDLRINSYND